MIQETLLKIIFTVWVLATTASAADPIGCYSSVNIAESKGTAQFQSSSSCSDSCSDYAYVALRDGQYCYCLSSAASSSNEVDSSNCDTQCQGYGQETCGGSNSFNVYPGKGDQGSGSASDSSSATSSSSSETPETSETSETSDSSSSSSSETSSSSSESSSVEASTSEADSSSSTSSSERGSVVTTASSSGGRVIYRTVTNTDSSSRATATPSSSSSSTSSSRQSRSANVGAIVGGVVGGVAGAAILGIAAFFFLKYRNRTDEDEEEFYEKGSASGSGLGRGGTGKSKYGTSPLDMPMTNPFTHPSDNAANTTLEEPGLADPRLNPMMGRRRISEGSLADEADYSRKILQVANPDS